MKKSILVLAVVLFSVLGITQGALAANKSHHQMTVLTHIGPISKIEVHGNVELYLSDGMTDNITVYSSDDAENAPVRSQNGVLKISCYKAETLVVWITVSNLANLKLYDQAQAKSFGKLSAIDLSVTLYNDASAQLNMDAYAVNMKINDRATATIEGSIREAEFAYRYAASLNTGNLRAERLTRTVNSYYPGKSLVEL